MAVLFTIIKNPMWLKMAINQYLIYCIASYNKLRYLSYDNTMTFNNGITLYLTHWNLKKLADIMQMTISNVLSLNEDVVIFFVCSWGSNQQWISRCSGMYIAHLMPYILLIICKLVLSCINIKHKHYLSYSTCITECLFPYSVPNH